MSRDSGLLPLNERKADWFFIVVFGLFVLTSVLADLVNAVSHPSPDSTYFWAKATYDLYAKNTDPLLVANPSWLRAMTFISAFVFAPFYVILIIAFIKGWNGIRPWALFYAGMIVESVIVLTFVQFRGEAELFAQVSAAIRPLADLRSAGISADLRVMNAPKYLAFNLPYAIFPILLAIRMARPAPFSAKRPRERDL